MKIIVLVKQVPDTYDERKLDPDTGILDRAASEPIIDEIGERAMEVALRHKDDNKAAEVVLLSMGPTTVTAARPWTPHRSSAATSTANSGWLASTSA